jgi:hypothetical protein
VIRKQQRVYWAADFPRRVSRKRFVEMRAVSENLAENDAIGVTQQRAQCLLGR